MLTEHFAPAGLGGGGLAMAINITLLTEFSCVCSNRKFLNSTAVNPGPLLGERDRVRILRNKISRFDPLNRQRRIGLGVLTPPRPSDVSSMPGGGVRTPSPTFRLMGF